MFYTIAVLLLIVWAVGYLGFHIGGNLIHVLLVIAIVVVLLRIIRGDKHLLPKL